MYLYYIKSQKRIKYRSDVFIKNFKKPNLIEVKEKAEENSKL